MLPIPDEVRMLAAKLHHEHPKWTNATIRNEIRAILHKNDESLPPDKRYPKDWPSKYAIDRIMPDIRERAKRSKFEPNPIDQPWTIQSMSKSEYHIPPEALPSVLQVWFLAKQKGISFGIRDAQWVSRLYTAVTDIDALHRYSFLASTAELYAERAGIEDFIGYEAVNLFIFSTMTGRVLTSKESKRVIGIAHEIRPKTADAVAWMESMWTEGLEPNMPKGYGDWELQSFEDQHKTKEAKPSEKEAQNERHEERNQEAR